MVTVKGVLRMDIIINLIKEYGELENRVGFVSGMNKGNVTTEEFELRNLRNNKYIELQEKLIKLNKGLIEDN